jgi:hypothetical protein
MMPRAKLTGPDGRTAWLNVPDDASEEDIQGAIRGAMQQWPSADQQKSLSWSEVPGKALENAPASAVKFGEAILQPILHPIDTANAIGNIAKGGASKIAGAVGFDQDPEQKAQTEAGIDAVGGFFKDRYGSVDALKNTLATDPVGSLADASLVLTGGAALPARAPGIVGKAAQVVGKVGSAVDPIANAGRALKGAGKVTAAVLGTTTGAGSTPVRAAFDAGRQGNRAFVDNMRGNVPMEDTIGMAKSAVGEMRSDRSAAYKAGMATTNANPNALNIWPIYRSLRNATQSISMGGFSKSPDAAKAIEAMEAAVSDWRNTAGPYFNSAEGMDALKQRMGDIMESYQPNTQPRRVVENVYNTIKDEIVKQSPEYAKTMQDYSTASNQIKEIERTLSLGRNAAQDTALRKLQSTQRNNVNANYGQRGKLLDDLAQYEPDLPYALAGQSLNSATPRGLQGMVATGTGITSALSNPAALAALPAFSPRVVGEAAHGAGQVARGVDAASQALRVSPEAAQNALLSLYALAQSTQPALRGGSGPRYDEYGRPRQ